MIIPNYVLVLLTLILCVLPIVLFSCLLCKTKKYSKSKECKQYLTLDDFRNYLRIISATYLDGSTTYHIEKYEPEIGTWILYDYHEKIVQGKRTTLFEVLVVKEEIANKLFKRYQQSVITNSFVVDNKTCALSFNPTLLASDNKKKK